MLSNERSLRLGIFVLGVIAFFSSMPSLVEASCNFNQFVFGSPLEAVAKTFDGAEPVEQLPSIPNLTHQTLSFSGNQVCPGDLSFTAVIIRYQFVADQLVQIQLQYQEPASSMLTLLEWATRQYGRPIIETRGPLATMSSGQWSWNAGDQTIFFYFHRRENLTIQELTIESKAVESLLQQRWQVMEESPLP